MGYYINPPNMSKEAFLQKHGKVISANEVNDQFNGEALPVCLVNNEGFTAAAIAYDPREANEFLRNDGRRKQWFVVTKEDLKPYYS